MQMNWDKLLTSKRLGKKDGMEDPNHPTFQRDFDRIIFSSAFRRLQDKTQVFPLAENDYVRTRLTHSLEVSCVGRSLGTIIGGHIIKKYNLEHIHSSDIGSIVSAACLAHDIGNPPLGHSGEDAIKNWFTDSTAGKQFIKDFDDKEKNDFINYEGNAQGFRVLARLQTPDNKGGMQLTCSTLAAYSKYPRESYIPINEATWEGESFKKWGFFQHDKDLFRDVANTVELIKRSPKHNCWCRHPLSFIVEAADDITYRIIDFEDGYRTGHISFSEFKSWLSKIIDNNSVTKKLSRLGGEKEKVEFLRSKAINTLIHQIVDVFIKNEQNILKGIYDKDLISEIESSGTIKKIKDISKEKIYKSKHVIEIEAAGFHVLSRLLHIFLLAIEDVDINGDNSSYKSDKLLELLPKQFLGPNRKPDKDRYLQAIKVCDYVSGMTDSYAVNLYKKITGISLQN